MLDPQLKRGLLDICVLSCLSRGDSYGYKIIKDLSAYIQISDSTLYPILRRLENAGALTEYSVAHSGRLRKFYSITDAGRRQIDDFWESWKEVAAIYDYVREGLSK